ncbi:MAG: ERF family protein, partial [Oleispira sp.]|nr:ERF family protein [Oleispira sp.]
YKNATAGKGSFQYNYADLPSIVEAIAPHLVDAGLVYSQPLSTQDGVRGLRTILCHLESGEIIEGFVPIGDVELKGQNDYQALGSGITYLRRYSLESILGLVTTKDDDAGGSNQNNSSSKPEPVNLPKLSPSSKMWAGAVDYLKKNPDVEKSILPHYSLIPADLKRLKGEAGIK